MDVLTATRTLSALSQPSRLEAFRLLMRAGADGLAAGEISKTLGIPHNTLSSHLTILVHAGVVTCRRNGRSIIYSVAISGVRDLLIYLLEDCCQGRPQVCRPVLQDLLP